MTDTSTQPEITTAAVLKALRNQFGTYVILHTKNHPVDVATCFLDQFVGPYDQATLAALSDALRGASFWNPDQVATLLVDAYNTHLAAFLDDHIKVIPVGFSDFGPENVVGVVNPLPTSEDDDLPSLEGAFNPFADFDPDDVLGSPAVAGILGRGRSYIKDHAEDLGGTKNSRGQWKFRAGDLVNKYQTHRGE